MDKNKVLLEHYIQLHRYIKDTICNKLYEPNLYLEAQGTWVQRTYSAILGWLRKTKTWVINTCNSLFKIDDAFTIKETTKTIWENKENMLKEFDNENKDGEKAVLSDKWKNKFSNLNKQRLELSKKMGQVDYNNIPNANDTNMKNIASNANSYLSEELISKIAIDANQAKDSLNTIIRLCNPAFVDYYETMNWQIDYCFTQISGVADLMSAIFSICNDLALMKGTNNPGENGEGKLDGSKEKSIIENLENITKQLEFTKLLQQIEFIYKIGNFSLLLKINYLCCPVNRFIENFNAVGTYTKSLMSTKDDGYNIVNKICQILSKDKTNEFISQFPSFQRAVESISETNNKLVDVGMQTREVTENQIKEKTRILQQYLNNTGKTDESGVNNANSSDKELQNRIDQVLDELNISDVNDKLVKINTNLSNYQKVMMQSRHLDLYYSYRIKERI